MQSLLNKVRELLRAKQAPIRKVVAGLIASALVYAARRAGVDLGSDEANELAQGLAPLVIAYLVRDPRVK